MSPLNRIARRTAFVLALLAGVATAWPTLAAVPNTLVVDGLLSSSGGGAAADGVYDVTFSIYNVQSGGSAAWTEGVTKVAVKNGQFTHTLGVVKPLTAAVLGQLTKAWLGLKVGADPELPRQPMHAVAYAVLADTATKLACSGCVGAGQIGTGAVTPAAVGFNYAGSKTKGGPANVAIDLSCTGCVSVAEMKFDKDVDLGGNALKASKVMATSVVANTATATSFIGDGSKLTGIKIPSGECKTAGQVVKGINPDGSLKCIAAMDPAALPKDGIDEISNYLIHNQFVDKTCGKANVPIPDNNPVGVSDKLVFPDIGLAQKLDIEVSVTNSNLSQVEIKLYDPNNVEYQLLAKGAGKGTSLTTVFPSKTKPAKGDLTTWVDKNPKGTWRLLVIDGAFKNNTTDGVIKNWCVSIQTLSNKKIKVQGNVIVNGNGTGAAGLQLNGTMKMEAADAAPCNATTKGSMRYHSTKGSQFCDGTYWLAALPKPVIYQGYCSVNRRNNSSWNYFCLDKAEINTAGDYLTVSTWRPASGDGYHSDWNSNKKIGQITFKVPGIYRVVFKVNAQDYHYRHQRVLKNGGTFLYGYAEDSTYYYEHTLHLEKTGVFAKGDYLHFQVDSNGANNSIYEWYAPGYHSHVMVEYLGQP